MNNSPFTGTELSYIITNISYCGFKGGRMKKTCLLALFACAVMILVSCTTTGYMINEEDTIPIVTYAGIVESDDYKVSIEGDYSNGVVARYLTVFIQNKTNVLAAG